MTSPLADVTSIRAPLALRKLAALLSGGSYNRIEELASCHFCVDIDRVEVAIFQECSGLSGEIEVETYQEGGLNDFAHKLPGRTTYGNVTLRGGVASALDLWEWFSGVSTGRRVQRRAVSIVMRSRGGDGGEVMRWNLLSAIPVRWQGPDLTAGDTNVAVHSLELAHNGIDLKQP